MSSYIGVIQKLVAKIGPYFLHGPNLSRLLESMALSFDSGIEQVNQGLRLSQPLRCDSSALPVLSKDRTLTLYPTEAVASKRVRLSQWMALHRQRGTHIGELKHAQPYYLPDVPVMRIVHQDGAGASATWHTLGSDGSYSIYRKTPSNWDYDGQTSKWSRFWVISYVPERLLEQHYYGDGARYGSGARYASAVTTQHARDMINLILEWQSGHSRMQAYIVATDPNSFNPTTVAVWPPTGGSTLPAGNWGQPIDSAGVRTRLPSAIWLYDRGP